MILYPAIDLMDGKAVRLQKGQRDKVTVYGDPLDFAARLRDAGAQWLHLVDLDAAFDGVSHSLPLISRIVEVFGGPVELGGGLRSVEDIRRRMDLGIARCIIGTAACEQPRLVGEACAEWPGRIAAGIDARDGKVALRGWVDHSELTAVELGLRMKALGVTCAIYTDVNRDGMMRGPNIPATRQLIARTGLAVTASGGISCLEDLRSVREAGCAGAILGKALYEHAFSLEEALETVKEEV